MDQFILFGDSITQQSFDTHTREFATGAALADVYTRKLDVVNRGLSGYNTDQALIVLPRIIPHPNSASVRLLTIFFGANDARLPQTGGGPQQHVPVHRYKENLTAIVKHPALRAHKDLRVLLITPAPVDERRLREEEVLYRPEPGPDFERRRTANAAAQYADAVREVGSANGVEVLDLWTIMMTRAGWDGGELLTGALEAPQSTELRDYLHDGLHFSAAGYTLLYDELMSFIARHWPDLMPGALPMSQLRWDDIEGWAREGYDVEPSA